MSRKYVLFTFNLIILLLFAASSFGNQQKILIIYEGQYTFFGLAKFLRENNYQVDIIDMNNVMIINELLDKHTQVWFFGSNAFTRRILSNDEINSIISFQRNGGSLLLVTDHEYRPGQYCRYGGDYTVNFDLIAKTFGVECVGCIWNPSLISYLAWRLFSPNIIQHEIWESVSQITAHDSECEMKIDNPNVQIIGRMQNGFPILAIKDRENCTEGRIAFDSTFGRYADGLLHQGDNRQYVLNIAKWLGEKTCTNNPPVAIAQGNQFVELQDCNGATVMLDGSASYDPDGDPLTYRWSWANGSAEGSNPIILLPLGIHQITLTVDDGKGLTSTDTLTVTVVDTTPPDLKVIASPNVLWPPNHKYIPVNLTLLVSDACVETTTVQLLNVTSNESDNGQGDGNTSNDVLINADGSIMLRAERSGSGSGRVYTITYKASDISGNFTISSATVFVPLEMNKR